MKQKGNPLAQFLIGLAMLVSGGYWFLSSVAVHTAFYSIRLGGMRLNGGLVVVPFIVGVIWICVNTDSFGGKTPDRSRTFDDCGICHCGNRVCVPLYQSV